jgi:hypothetical protein
MTDLLQSDDGLKLEQNAGLHKSIVPFAFWDYF